MPRGVSMETGKNKDNALSLSYPMLNRANYTAWALKVKVNLQAHGVWEAVSPKDPKAVVEDKVDKQALAAIYQGIPEDILLSIADKGTAKEAWDAIKVLCQGADRVKQAKIQTLKTEFESLTMRDSDSLDDFCMKMSGLVTNIRVLGEEVAETYVVKKLLRAVPQKFLQIASTIEQFGNLEKMTIEETVGSLKAHEERLKGKTESGSSELLLTEEEWQKREKEEHKLLLTRDEWMKHNNKAGSDSSSQRFRGREGVRGFRDKSKLRCFNCHGFGHFARDCKSNKRDKETKDEVNISQIPDEEPALLLTECKIEDGSVMLVNEEKVVPKLKMNRNENQCESNLWYLDNGASNHMTGIRSKFKTLNENITGQVKFGDGSMVSIKWKGSVGIMCKDGKERLLREVYYIPSLCNNIISLGQLSEQGNLVVLKGDFLWVRDKNGILVMKVKRSMNRLYKIILEPSVSSCMLSKIEDHTWLWHSRLGHVNFNAMMLMSSTNMVHGLPSLSHPKEPCTGCLMAKQTRKAFPSKSNFCAKKTLELVHGDLCRPISPCTPAGNKYVFLLVDDFSSVMWAYLLKTKDEALGAFKKFRAQVENGDRKVQTFRTDRGGEFCSLEFNKYCQDAGIHRNFTAPDSPQQNGVVERRNRTIIEMARSLLKGMKLPNNLWGEAIRHSVYLLNRLPTRSVSGVTPYEAWSGKKPHLEYVRIFGCVAHMKVPSVHLKKIR